LTQENLQILQEQYKSIKKTSTTARIIKWLSEIPQNLGSADNMSTSNIAKEGNEFQSQDMNNKTGDNLGSQPQQRSLEKINKDTSHQSFNEYNNNSPNKKNSISNNDYDRMKKMNAPGAANNTTEKRSSRDKGRLCCYLKVEVGGNTQLLPIHENDIPQNLAYNFCKANNILNSVNSLKEHIINAIENYIRIYLEEMKNQKKNKVKKSKIKLNGNNNKSEKSKISKSTEISLKNRNEGTNNNKSIQSKIPKSNENILKNRNEGTNNDKSVKSKISKSNENILKNRSRSKAKTNIRTKTGQKTKIISERNLTSKNNFKNNESLKKKSTSKYLKSTTT